MSAADANISFAWERLPGRGVSPELERCARTVSTSFPRLPNPPKSGRCAALTAHCPALGEVAASGRSISPKQRRCATSLAYRPALGESCQFGHRIAAHLAQRPGLGEIGSFGTRQASAKPLVGVLAFACLLLSRDVVPAFFSQAETLCQKRTNCALVTARLSRARTTFTIFGALSRLGRDGA